MACCTLEGTDKAFSRQANRYDRRFRRKGPDRAQRAILRALEKHGLKGRSVLEIGCGVGGLLLSMLEKGGSIGLGVEISEGMIAKAKEIARDFGMSGRVTYLKGDFTSLHAAIPVADIVVLDKVLCCYSDPRKLIEQSSSRAAAFYAVSYPRDARMSRLFFTMSERMGTLLRWSFHPFFHEPRDLEESILSQGLEEIDTDVTPIWQVKIFCRGKGV